MVDYNRKVVKAHDSIDMSDFFSDGDGYIQALNRLKGMLWK
jgi:hypothetical protein